MFFHLFYCEKTGSVMLVQPEEVLDALGFVGEGLWTVAQIHGPVQLLMRFYQVGRHGERIVEIGQGKLL